MMAGDLSDISEGDFVSLRCSARCSCDCARLSESCRDAGGTLASFDAPAWRVWARRRGRRGRGGGA